MCPIFERGGDVSVTFSRPLKETGFQRGTYEVEVTMRTTIRDHSWHFPSQGPRHTAHARRPIAFGQRSWETYSDGFTQPKIRGWNPLPTLLSKTEARNIRAREHPATQSYCESEVQVKGLQPWRAAANSSGPLNGAGLLGRFL